LGRSAEIDAGEIAIDRAGEIVALGKDVSGFAVGDQVIALAPASFSTFVTTHFELVASPSYLEVNGKPATLDTKVRFTMPGAYRLRAIASDGQTFSTYDVDVTVR